MSFYPMESNLMSAFHFQKPFPKIHIFHRFILSTFPAFFDPSVNPVLVKCIHHILNKPQPYMAGSMLPVLRLQPSVPSGYSLSSYSPATVLLYATVLFRPHTPVQLHNLPVRPDFHFMHLLYKLLQAFIRSSFFYLLL